MQWLKQSTAVTLKIGPFVDEDDGKAAETGLAIAQADVRLSMNGGNMAQKTEASACTHDEIGVYNCPIDATDTGTLGRLQLFVHEAGALPVWHEFMVVPANVWDSFFGADYLHTNVAEISEDAAAANNAESFFDGTGYAGTNNVIPTISALTGHTAQTGDSFARLAAPAGVSVSADIAAIKAETATIVADTNELQTDDVPTLIAALPTAAENRTEIDTNSTQLGAIVADTNELQTDWADGGRLDNLLDGASAPSAAAVADAVWDEAIADHAGAGSTGAALSAASAPTAAAVADAVWDETLADHDTEDTVGNVLNDLTEESAGTYRFTADALQSTLGAGAITVTYTITSTADSAPIPDVTVWVTSDAGGSQVLASGITDANGVVTFYLDAGTVYVWRQKSGWDFTNPDTETVS